MQITSLISNDGIMSSLNVSIETDDFVDRLDDFISIWYYDKMFGGDYPVQMSATWNTSYPVNFMRVLHPKGFCYTFNFPEVSEVFNLNRLKVAEIEPT